TNVASVAAGSGGVAPGANIIALQVLQDNGAGSFSKIEKGLQWVVANAAAYNIVAVNLSLGDGQNYATPQALDGINDELAALAAENVIVVSAAGNAYKGTAGVGYPAADANSLAVSAVWDSDCGYNFWNTGATDFTS